MDELIDMTFMQALVTSLDDGDLPVETSSFFSTLLASRPPGTSIDIKASSYKKVGKLMQTMKKRKIIKLEERKGATYIKKVERHAKELKQHVPWSSAEHAEDDDGAGVDKESGIAQASSRPAPEVIALFKPKSGMEPFFEEEDEDADPELEAELPPCAESIAEDARGAALCAPAPMLRRPPSCPWAISPCLDRQVHAGERDARPQSLRGNSRPGPVRGCELERPRLRHHDRRHPQGSGV